MRRAYRPLGAAVALGVITAACGQPPSSSRQAGIHKIKHVIVIMQENRSFDSYFGTYPGANGIPMANGVPTACSPNPQSGVCVKPFVDHADVNGGGPHGVSNATADINGGMMNGFYASALGHNKGCAATTPECASSATPDVMGYHTQTDIPNYWAYARDFVLQDHMFEPNASWSLPAHLFMVSEWSARCQQHDNPASCKNAVEAPGLPPDDNAKHHVPIYAWTDLTYLLHKHGVCWGYYVVTGTEPDCENDASAHLRTSEAERDDAGDLESAPLLRHREDRRPARQHPARHQLLRRREGGHPAGGLVGGPRPVT